MELYRQVWHTRVPILVVMNVPQVFICKIFNAFLVALLVTTSSMTEWPKKPFPIFLTL